MSIPVCPSFLFCTLPISFAHFSNWGSSLVELKELHLYSKLTHRLVQLLYVSIPTMPAIKNAHVLVGLKSVISYHHINLLSCSFILLRCCLRTISQYKYPLSEMLITRKFKLSNLCIYIIRYFGGWDPCLNTKLIYVSYIHSLNIILYIILNIILLVILCIKLSFMVWNFVLWHHVGGQNILDSGVFWVLDFQIRDVYSGVNHTTYASLTLVILFGH